MQKERENERPSSAHSPIVPVTPSRFSLSFPRRLSFATPFFLILIILVLVDSLSPRLSLSSRSFLVGFSDRLVLPPSKTTSSTLFHRQPSASNRNLSAKESSSRTLAFDALGLINTYTSSPTGTRTSPADAIDLFAPSKNFLNPASFRRLSNLFVLVNFRRPSSETRRTKSLG